MWVLPTSSGEHLARRGVPRWPIRVPDARATKAPKGATPTAKLGASTSFAPTAQAVDAANGTLYVANGNTVSVINEVSGTVNATVAAEGDPSAVLFDAATSELYVVNSFSELLTEVSTATCNASSTAGCASATTISSSYLDEPSALALDGTTLYVADQGNRSVAIFDVANGQFVGSTTLPSGADPNAMAVDASHTVYVSDSANDAVDFFNGATCNDVNQSGCSASASEISMNDPDTLVLDSSANELFVGSVKGGISVVDTIDNAIVTTINTANVAGMFVGSPGTVGSMTMAPNNQDVLADVTTAIGTVLATIDPTSNTVLGTVNWNTGADSLGQLVSDPLLDLVWAIDPNNDSDAVEDFSLGVDEPRVPARGHGRRRNDAQRAWASADRIGLER